MATGGLTAAVPVVRTATTTSRRRLVASRRLETKIEPGTLDGRGRVATRYCIRVALSSGAAETSTIAAMAAEPTNHPGTSSNQLMSPAS